MVKISDLNGLCSNRKASRKFPAQILCRLFGNELEPCKLNKICEPCEEKGLWYLYAALLFFILIAYVLLFWLLRLTKLSKVFYPIFMLLIIPVEWLAISFAACVRFIRQLPFD